MSETNKSAKELADFYWAEWEKVDKKIQMFGISPKLRAEESRLWDLYSQYEKKHEGGN
jgi:hypothetical protein